MEMYFFVAIGFGVLVLLWYLLTKHKKPGAHPVKPEGKKLSPVAPVKGGGNHHNADDPIGSTGLHLTPVLARIYDNVTRTIRNEELPVDAIKQIRTDYGNLGRRWLRDGEWLYEMVRLTAGDYVPVQKYISLSLKNPPERLHRALQQEETESYYRPRDNRGILAKYGSYLLFAGVVVVILFLWGANMMR